MKLKWFIPIILMALLVIPTSASFLNYPVNPVSLAGDGTVAFAGSAGHSLIKNSSGAIFATHLADSNTLYKLVWSTDDGITWKNESFLPSVGGIAIPVIQPDIAIDSSDLVHLVYATNIGTVEHRTYSSAGGFSSADVFIGPLQYSTSIDSNDILHIAMIDVTTYDLYYSNISPITGVASLYTIDSLVDSVMLNVDRYDIVHIIYTTEIGGGQQMRYVNFSSSGWGNIINMTGIGIYPTIYGMVISSDDKIHLIYRGGVPPVLYANVSPLSGFKLSNPPITIGNAIYFSTDSLAVDSNDIIHFTETGRCLGNTANCVRYRNISSAGMSPSIELVLPFLPFTGSRNPRMLWSVNPPGNIVDSGMEFIYTATGGGVSRWVYYGVFGPDAPIPVPTSPFNSVSIQSTSQLIQMVIIIGVMLLILAAIAMLILHYLPNE